MDFQSPIDMQEVIARVLRSRGHTSEVKCVGNTRLDKIQLLTDILRARGYERQSLRLEQEEFCYIITFNKKNALRAYCS